jgi:serine/threonine-protein kinase RsbW
MGRTDGPASYEQSFQPVPDSAGAARRFARDALSRLGLEDYWDQVALVVGEMAVNAVLHGRTTYRIVLSVPASGTVRIEAYDANHDAPRQKTSMAADPLTYGRGLILIEANSDRWGYHATPEGKLVWAEVDV